MKRSSALSGLTGKGFFSIRKACRRTRWTSRTFDRVFVVGGGKATAPMARAVEDLFGERITKGIINVKYGFVEKLRRTEIIEAGHPLPDQKGVEGTRKIVDLLQSAGEGDLVFSLISGGGSALLPLTAEGITLPEKQALTQKLLECGASDRGNQRHKKTHLPLQGRPTGKGCVSCNHREPDAFRRGGRQDGRHRLGALCSGSKHLQRSLGDHPEIRTHGHPSIHPSPSPERSGRQDTGNTQGRGRRFQPRTQPHRWEQPACARGGEGRSRTHGLQHPDPLF